MKNCKNATKTGKSRLLLLGFYGMVVAFCFFAATTSAQENFTQIGSVGDEFTFIRIQFDAMGQGWGNGGWAHDYPDAEINFLRGVTRLSGIQIGRAHV